MGRYAGTRSAHLHRRLAELLPRATHHLEHRGEGGREDRELRSLGILKGTTGRKRDRACKHAPYLDLLTTGAELVPDRASRP
jgi:hypothetical protein